MKEIVFLLEEISAKAMLEGLLPKIVPNTIQLRFIPFEGKQDLEKQLVKKIQGYKNPEASFIVLRDQDLSPDCKKLKAKLVQLSNRTGRNNILIRIACHMLESFYLADLAAVEKGLNIHGLARQQSRVKFRTPDYIASPYHELAVLTKGRYQKVSGSRSIGLWLDPNNKRSTSFYNLIAGIRRLISNS